MNDQYSASGFTAIQFAPKIQKFCVGSDLGTASSVNKYNTPLVSNLPIQIRKSIIVLECRPS